MNNENYYLKYLKYKKKYLELKGGGIECRGDNMEIKSLQNPFGYSIFSHQNLYDHFGNCFSKVRFGNFLDIARSNNVTVLDMVNAGFTYHQIIVSEIDTEDNIYNEIWNNHINLINKNKYFFLRAISQGYLRLLAKNDSSPILDDVIFMVKLCSDSFEYKVIKEPFDNKILILAFNMLLKIQNVKDSKGKTTDSNIGMFWSRLEKYNIFPYDLKKLR
jgi:hypothetical protein